MSTLTADRHREEIEETRRFWQAKPSVRAAYDDFYGEIALHVDRQVGGPIVEIGSGMAQIKNRIPDCVTTDLFQNPGIDRVESAYRLSFRDHEVGNLILFDVWHHLEAPGVALREFQRVLRAGGRVILFEPALGLLGRIAFGHFHHEPLGLEHPLPAEAPSGWNATNAPYYAAQGNAWRLFVRGENPAFLRGWKVRTVKLLVGLPYLASGGFRGPQLAPRPLWPVVRMGDRLLAPFGRVLASRMLVVLQPEGVEA